MLKRCLASLIISLLVLSQTAAAYAVNVVIDDTRVEFSKDSGQPFIDSSSRAQVPFRIVLEEFGCVVAWDQENRHAVAYKNGIEVRVPIGESHLFINGVKKANDTSARIRDGRTYLPIRAVLEAFGAAVAWDPYTYTVVVDSSGAAITIRNPALAKMEKAVVDRTIDGDTFVLESGEKVRMIGIDTPEVAGPYTEAEYYGKQASDFTASALTGKTVYLEKDVSNTDKYGRLLRYVYLEDGTFFDLLLVQNGYAEAHAYSPDVKYSEILEAAEKEARAAGAGLWGN